MSVMIKDEGISIGQAWMRKNGKIVLITNKRKKNGCVEYELTPQDGNGRRSWKWYGAVKSELQRVPEFDVAQIEVD